MTRTWIVCFLAMAATLGVGGALTTIGPWYHALKVPPWKPPNWAFGPIWTLIGICTAIAAALAWRAAQNDAGRQTIIVLFAINAALNIGWSLLFFRLRRPDWALVEVVFLWTSVLAPLVAVGSMRTTSGLLLLPYLLWVTIAAALNLSVVRLNAPFGTRDLIETMP